MVENSITQKRPFKDVPQPSPNAQRRRQQMRNLASFFPVGSLVYHGPFVGDAAPQLYRVVPVSDRRDSVEGVYWSSTLNAYFVRVECIEGHRPGKIDGQPPHTLTPVPPKPSMMLWIVSSACARRRRVNIYEAEIDRLNAECNSLSVRLQDAESVAYHRGVRVGREQLRAEIRQVI